MTPILSPHHYDTRPGNEVHVLFQDGCAATRWPTAPCTQH